MPKPKLKHAIASIIGYRDNDSGTSTVTANTATETFDIELNRQFSVPPVKGDEIELLQIANLSQISDIDEPNTLSKAIPIEVKVRHIRTSLCVDFDYVVESLRLDMKADRTWWQSLTRTRSDREQFILDVENARHQYARPRYNHLIADEA